jgi:hypothetical protein
LLKVSHDSRYNSRIGGKIWALLTLPISLDTVSDSLLVKLATKPI